MEAIDRDPADDASLIERSLRRPEVFAELYDRHAAPIHRFAARRLGDSAAEDVVAETFLAAFAKRRGYDPGFRDARPWLYGIATRLIGKQRRAELRMWRAIARSVPAEAADVESAAADDRVAALSAQPALAAALAELPGPDRHALLLFAWAELSYQEIAVALGIPVGTVRSRLNRARAQLRVSLERHDTTPSIKELTHGRT